MNLLFLDIETTGLDPDLHRIIQVSAEFHSNGKLVEKFNERICHNLPNVDLGALKVNRIDYGRLHTYGKTEVTTITLFLDFLLNLNKQHKDIVLVGNNVAFDVSFIKQTLKRLGITGLDSILPYRVIDTAGITRFLQSLDTEPFKGLLGDKSQSLSVTAKALGLELPENLHDSAADVELTATVFYTFQQLLKGLVNEDLAKEVSAT
jgi:DNA polymerase III alpha subunit (gram-positive type)